MDFKQKLIDSICINRTMTHKKGLIIYSCSMLILSLNTVYYIHGWMDFFLVLDTYFKQIVSTKTG